MDWDTYFMNIAHEVAKKSKDPSTQVGAVIVSEDNEPISFGYNGMVRGCDEKEMTWDRPLKYNLVIHAEMNAILFAKRSLKGAKLYVTHAPCDNCLKHVLQTGIREIYYADSSLTDRFDDNMKLAIIKLKRSMGVKLIGMTFRGLKIRKNND